LLQLADDQHAMKIVHIEGKGYSRATKDGLARGIPDHSLSGNREKDDLANATTQLLMFNSQFHF
jgi:hypothetical protein